MERVSVSRSLIGTTVVAALSLMVGLSLPQPLLAQQATPAAGGPPLPPGAERVASGLDNPRGLAFGPDGVLYVSEAGGTGDGECISGPEGEPECWGATSAITAIRDGQASRLVEGIRSRAHEDGSRATGAQDVAFGPDGALYVVIGLGNPPESRTSVETGGAAHLGRLFRVDTATGEMTEVADVAGYEQSANPDGGAPDSNPYSLAPLPDGGFAVADAGGNDVVRVSPDGAMSTMAVFAPMPATGPDGSEIPMQAVPDAVAVGPQGEVVVGQLTGFPFPPGGASVWTVNADGSTSVLADGFTNIIDLAWGADGTLYVLEWNRGGMMQIDPASPATLEGRLVAIAPDGQEREIASAGLISPGGVAIGPDGALYLTTFSVMEDMGQVIRLQIP